MNLWLSHPLLLMINTARRFVVSDSHWKQSQVQKTSENVHGNYEKAPLSTSRAVPYGGRIKISGHPLDVETHRTKTPWITAVESRCCTNELGTYTKKTRMKRCLGERGKNFRLCLYAEAGSMEASCKTDFPSSHLWWKERTLCVPKELQTTIYYTTDQFSLNAKWRKTISKLDSCTCLIE